MSHTAWCDLEDPCKSFTDAIICLNLNPTFLIIMIIKLMIMGGGANNKHPEFFGTVKEKDASFTLGITSYCEVKVTVVLRWKT